MPLDKCRDRERKRRQKEEANEIGKIPKCKHPRKRAACKKSLYQFLVTYCMGVYGFLKTAPSERMREIIDKLQDTVINGGRTHLRLPRGHGKTSLIKGACLYALVYGYKKFLVCVSARRADAINICEDIWTLIENSDEFAEDFPEVAFPIRALQGVSQRAHNQLCCGVRTRIQKTAEKIVLPTIKGSVSSGSLMVARGFKGAARGLVRGNQRPDILLMDDLADDKSARNPHIVAQMDETIEKSLLALGGHDTQLAAFMTSTPICVDDLSEQYAKKTNWVCFTYRMILHEPNCWRSENDLWERYYEIRKDSIANGEPEHVKANEFYQQHREAMDDGGEVLNPDFYDRATELSGLQHAMNLRFVNGEAAFSSEFQLSPRAATESFRVSAPLIASRVRKGIPEFTIPEDTVFTCCATDLNIAYALSTVFCAFAKDQTCFVPHYGLFTSPPLPIPDNLPERLRAQQIQKALVLHYQQIVALCRQKGIVLNKAGTDASGKAWEAVNNFAKVSRQLSGISILPMVGRGGRNWNPNVRSRIADERNGTVLCADQGKGWRWLAWDADRYKETSQKSWLGEPGTIGSLSLFDGARHGEFASQCASEILEFKIELPNGKTEYKWRQIGQRWDFGDCLAMCYALAGAWGISSTGYEPPPQKKKVVHRFKVGKWKK